MEEQQLPTTVTEVLEQITDAARAILDRLQRGESALPQGSLTAYGPEVDQHVLAALVVGVAKIIAETNQIVLALSSGESKRAEDGKSESPFLQLPKKESAGDYLGGRNVGFFG